jgi:predicted RNA-binding protein YlxR (DUF448 family)
MTLKNNSNKKQSLPRKRIPQRSCVACRETKGQRELIRLVCNNSIVEINTGRKRTGRGAYLCPRYECWETGLKKNRLEYALRTKLTLENRQMLVEYGKSLSKKQEVQR